MSFWWYDSQVRTQIRGAPPVIVFTLPHKNKNSIPGVFSSLVALTTFVCEPSSHAPTTRWHNQSSTDAWSYKSLCDWLAIANRTPRPWSSRSRRSLVPFLTRRWNLTLRLQNSRSYASGGLAFPSLSTVRFCLKLWLRQRVIGLSFIPLAMNHQEKGYSLATKRESKTGRSTPAVRRRARPEPSMKDWLWCYVHTLITTEKRKDVIKHRDIDFPQKPLIGIDITECAR